MRDAVRALRLCGAEKAADYGARALKSADGAHRHALLKCDRARREEDRTKAPQAPKAKRARRVEHSPTPWTISERGEIHGPEEAHQYPGLTPAHIVATVVSSEFGSYRHYSAARAAANRRAIAAVPDVIDALEKAEPCVRYVHEREGCPQTLRAVIDALKKAKGGAR